jgi:hypothetical protein
LRCEIFAKIDSIAGLFSKTFTAESIASQNDLACGVMKVTQRLEEVERGLDEERQTRKDEIAALTKISLKR